MRISLAVLAVFAVMLAALVLLDGYRNLDRDVAMLARANVDLQQQVKVLEDRLADVSGHPAQAVEPATEASLAARTPVAHVDLERLVARLIAENRAENRVRAQSTIDQRLRNWRARRDGLVDDSLSGRTAMLRDALALDAAQASEYEAISARFEARAEALYGTVDATDMRVYTTQMNAIQADLDALHGEFDAAFSAVLTADQLRRYEALPADSRGLAPDAGVQAMTFDLAKLLRISEDERAP